MQKITLYFLFFVTGIHSIAFTDESTSDQTRNDAKDKLESAFEKTAIGTLEVGIGVWRASKGDVIGAAGATIDGFNRIKDGVYDFKESKELFDRAREFESRLDEPPDIMKGLPDREY